MNQRERLAAILREVTVIRAQAYVAESRLLSFEELADMLLARGVRVVDPTDTTGDLAYEAGREDGRVELARRIEERVISLEPSFAQTPDDPPLQRATVHGAFTVFREVFRIVREEAAR